jgi:hypothetical protein
VKNIEKTGVNPDTSGSKSRKYKLIISPYISRRNPSICNDCSKGDDETPPGILKAVIDEAKNIFKNYVKNGLL